MSYLDEYIFFCLFHHFCLGDTLFLLCNHFIDLFHYINITSRKLNVLYEVHRQISVWAKGSH